MRLPLVAAAALAAALALGACDRLAAAKAKAGSEAADLVVYSSHPEDIIRVVVAEFRDRTGLRVRVAQGGTGEMLKRLRASPGACDVLWGGGAESLAANADLFEPYVSPEAAAIPAAYKAADGTWTGFTVLPMVIGYNVRLLAADRVPRSWAELLEPRFKGGIAYADPAVSGSSFTILRTIGSALSSRGGQPRAAVEEAFVRNLDGRLLPESSAVFPAVASGEFLVGLYHDEGARELMISGSDLGIVYPRDGTSAVPDGVALVRGSPRSAAARRFVDFVLGPDVAGVMSTRFHRRSARSDCPTPTGQLPLSRIRLAPYDIVEAAAEKAETLARFKAFRDAAALP
jgi:iron(III) transport system substrate-binding protein